jgi:hypothetical protein
MSPLTLEEAFLIWSTTEYETDPGQRNRAWCDYCDIRDRLPPGTSFEATKTNFRVPYEEVSQKNFIRGRNLVI